MKVTVTKAGKPAFKHPVIFDTRDGSILLPLSTTVNDTTIHAVILSPDGAVKISTAMCTTTLVKSYPGRYEILPEGSKITIEI